ncbi:MAG: hypothetical protein ACXVZ3_02285 [Gaiellaceae bacterium]
METTDLATRGARSYESRLERLLARTGGADGNERLTAATAVVLLVLLAIEGVTILFLRPLLSVHIFVGILLVPPVALKLGTVGYRFARYYSGSRPYRVKGPPHLFMRVLVAPVLVFSTIGLFATGVALIVTGPGGGIMLGLHKASFAVWFIAMSVHVLAYVLRVPGLVRADWRRSGRENGGYLRSALLAGSLVAGLTLALFTLQYAGPWLHWVQAFHGDH